MSGAFAALQAMLGYWGTPGAGPAFGTGPWRPIPIGSRGLMSGGENEYKVPQLYRSHDWAEAVLLLDKVRSGQLSGKEYMRTVGWKADPSTLKDFNPKVLFWGGHAKPHATDHVSINCSSSNRQVEAMKKMEFIFTMHSIHNSTNLYADIILPARDWMWEEKGVTKSQYGGFESINYCPEVVPPPGETKAWAWVYIKIGQRLGIDTKKLFSYYSTDENWEKDWERCQKDMYQRAVEYYLKQGVTVPPWEEFIQGKFINCDEYEEKPHTGWDAQIKEGKPFRTESQKIEIYSNYIADENKRGKGEHYDWSGRLYDNLPADWGDMTPLPTYRAIPRGMDDELTRKYPLFLLTSHSRYRVHSLFWEHAWLRDHVYQHRVWINAADAKSRGIKNNDMIMVFNAQGKVVMPAYVTRRMMPGTVLMHSGGKVMHDQLGIDFGASPSTLLGGETKSCKASARATSLVEIERYEGDAK
jgi:anaerobic dimethyl sulfoxide reductase subunit A